MNFLFGRSRMLGLLACWLLLLLIERLPAQVTDINPDNGRSDVLSAFKLNWPVKKSKTLDFISGDIHWHLEAIGPSDAQLVDCWWKAGYDFGAHLASDGVTTTEPATAIKLTITGLKPGKHTLVSWHNLVDADAKPGAVTITCSLTKTHNTLQPTRRVMHDDQAATNFIEFELTKPEPVEFLFESKDSQWVVINGLGLDIPDPALAVSEVSPADHEEHAVIDPVLKWKAPRAARALAVALTYQLYFGTSAAQVQAANEQSREYLGRVTALEKSVQASDCMQAYFWRVDVTWPDGRTTRGDVHQFKVRHKAFPTAEGYGQFAIGGRGGRVIEVTNLDDNGPGSLRAAVDTQGPRTVVFRVSGTIQLKSKLVIRHPYITIAGQTAPGDGICVRGYTFGCMGTHDVIMRHLRIRVGDESGQTMDGTGFASTDHAIIDHCSISWSIDEAVSSRSAKNITLQRCIVSEALNVANHQKYAAGKGHSFAGSISGDVGSFHHNLLAHCAGRNWSLAGGLDRGGHYAGRLDIRNNVVYNWQSRTNDGGVKALNLVNNLYLPGPASRVFHLLKPDAGSTEDRQQYFVSGNQMPGHFEADDNWTDAVNVDPELISAIRLDQPFCESLVTTEPVNRLLDSVLADVGCHPRHHDSIDRRIVEEVRGGKTTYQGSKTELPGIIDSQSDVGGWPELRSGTPPLDSDHDGMPDDWEVTNGLDPNIADQNTRHPSAPTALETYLNELVY